MAAGKQRKTSKRSLKKYFGTFWEGQRDRHLVILGMLTVLTFALIFWAIAFFSIFSSNAQQEANSWADLTAVTWVGVLLAFVLLLFVIPEFFHYLGIRNTLVDMLETDSRAEFQKNKKELDEGAQLLAGAWPARIEAKRVELGLRREMPEGMELPDNEGNELFGGWLNTKYSRLAQRFPDSHILKDPGINKLIIFSSLIGLVVFVYNALIGLARETMSSPRNMTVDFTSIMKGGEYNATWAPHLDLVGGLMIVIFAAILFMTGPASTDEDESKSDSSEEEE
jgi:succinate dehydrogenase/fumarate reductase cytochrome b subunit